MVIQAGYPRCLQFFALLAVLALVLFTPACTVQRKEASIQVGDREIKFSPELLKEKLKQFNNWFSIRIQTTADEIADRAPDNKIKKITIYWKIFAVPNCRNLVYQQDTSVALLDTWVFCKQLVQYFKSERSQALLGELSAIALKTCEEIEAEFRRIAAFIIPPEELEKVESALQEFVLGHPMSGALSRGAAYPSSSLASAADTLGWIMDSTLKPFRAFASMDKTAMAIQEAADAAEKMSVVANHIPEQVRWNLRLLAYNLEDLPSTASALKSLETMTENTDRLSKTVQEYPDRVQKVLTNTLEEVEKKQEGLRSTLKEAQNTLLEGQKTLTEGQKTLAELEKNLAQVEKTTQFLTKAGDSWKNAVQTLWDMIRDLSGPEEPGAGGKMSAGGKAKDEEKGRPFDILDYARTAEELGKAGSELQKAIAELKNLIASKELDSALKKSSVQVNSLVNRITLMAGLLIFITFVTALIYRLITRKGP